MMIRSPPVTVEWAGATLVLLPERAIWWARTETLFIADLHFGKAAAFRFAGVPVPELIHDEDLHRLERVVNRLAVNHLVILGDFFHARTGAARRRCPRWPNGGDATPISQVMGGLIGRD